MTKRFFIATAVCGLLSAPAAALAQDVVCTIGGKVVDARACIAALRKPPTTPKVAAAHSPKPTAPPAASLINTPAPPLAQGPAANPLRPYDSWQTSNTILVRNSLDDLGSFGSPTPLKKATGAEFSWARDAIAHNDTWTARGLVADRFSLVEAPSLSPYLVHALIAPYVSFDRVSNTTKKSSDVDDLVGGLSTEFAVGNLLNATHYFRFMAEEDTSFAGTTKNWNVAFEYQPFGNPQGENDTIFSYLGTPLNLGPYWFLTISPKFRAEYRSSQDGSTDPLFFSHSSIMRVGPSVTVAINGNDVGFSDVPWYIQRTHFRLTYGTLYDTLSSRNYDLLDTALSYDLDPYGYLALTLSYRKGQLETTGANVDIVKLSLSAKYGQ
ncbi:hypothetical protein ACVINW_001309 [Bradyrhizobium sp. USDA 4461]